MKNMRIYGPASIILAQGILESGAGRGDLAVSANNHLV
jgi:flagellum-specific peptidoglycan hydrolase FlgJ